MTTDSQTFDPEEDELMVCTACHNHNHPYAKYCLNCSAPLCSTAAWGPWEQTQAEGFVIRQAVTTDRPRPILLIGIWLMFGPAWLCLTVLFWPEANGSDTDLRDGVGLLAALFFWIISAAILYRCTANYFNRKPKQLNDAT